MFTTAHVARRAAICRRSIRQHRSPMSSTFRPLLPALAVCGVLVLAIPSAATARPVKLNGANAVKLLRSEIGKAKGVNIKMACPSRAYRGRIRCNVAYTVVGGGSEKGRDLRCDGTVDVRRDHTRGTSGRLRLANQTGCKDAPDALLPAPQTLPPLPPGATAIPPAAGATATPPTRPTTAPPGAPTPPPSSLGTASGRSFRAAAGCQPAWNDFFPLQWEQGAWQGWPNLYTFTAYYRCGYYQEHNFQSDVYFWDGYQSRFWFSMLI